MSSSAATIVRTLLRERSVAALGTVQNDEPYVSLVPFAVAKNGRSIIIHTSRLAAHTRNMQRNSRVSLLLAEPERSGKMAQSLARITIQGIARELSHDDAGYASQRGVYLERFASTAPMFDFADFSLFQIDVTSARLVGGFAQAATIDVERFAAALLDSGDG